MNDSYKCMRCGKTFAEHRLLVMHEELMHSDARNVTVRLATQQDRWRALADKVRAQSERLAAESRMMQQA